MIVGVFLMLILVLSIAGFRLQTTRHVIAAQAKPSHHYGLQNTFAKRSGVMASAERDGQISGLQQAFAAADTDIYIDEGADSNAIVIPDRARDIRKFPYPYRAMFAFASDIDETTPREFAVYHRFLNTKEMTPAGPGLGLDVGDTFWVYMADDMNLKVDMNGEGLDSVMTVFKLTDPNTLKNGNLIKHYADAGWIDGIHSFGDFSRKNPSHTLFTRGLAQAAWDVMNRLGIHPSYWINHGNEANRQNFGGYNPITFLKYQAGDDPKSPYYHTDLTVKNGIRFVWNSLGESQFGQDSPIFPITLRDGQKIWGFHRYTYDIIKGQIKWMWSADGDLYQALTKERLDQLMAKQQYCIYAEHFGGTKTPFTFYYPADVGALRMLADYHHNGKILVARTSRLLNYSVAQQFVQYKMKKKNGKMVIFLKSIQDPIFGNQEITIDKVRGLTFYVEDPKNTIVFVNKERVPADDLQLNPPDETGRASIGIKWFPADTTDYTKTAPAN
ncbi:hypothetical protein skT53_17810 [Effusibacillus dendaii]|uniref:Uncharacterized protein n=2 Tax=Effusibacillus dendaii TaxID=2743772 RepID=A0A7I8DDA7_9BACL|nr:hypothetical protein skT53_17810 [Effusibacillus dendaii]